MGPMSKSFFTSLKARLNDQMTDIAISCYGPRKLKITPNYKKIKQTEKNQTRGQAQQQKGQTVPRDLCNLAEGHNKTLDTGD